MTKNSSVVVSIVIFSSVPLLVRELQTRDPRHLQNKRSWNVSSKETNVKCPSEHLLFENQQICYLQSYNSPSSDDFLTPSQLSCLSVPESLVHVYVALSSGVTCTHEDADYRSSDLLFTEFFRPSKMAPLVVFNLISS